MGIEVRVLPKIIVSSQGWLYLAVSVNSGALFVGVLRVRALMFRVDIGAPNVWKLPNHFYAPCKLLDLRATPLKLGKIHAK